MEKTVIPAKAGIQSIHKSPRKWDNILGWGRTPKLAASGLICLLRSMFQIAGFWPSPE
ncbi:MAG: hypothetical protein M0P59_02675 [Gallionella sp.]|nr:hypothetical protein [Gallionella sp.]MCK9353043.1 hypothetical protein [Gallionella sp.]